MSREKISRNSSFDAERLRFNPRAAPSFGQRKAFWGHARKSFGLEPAKRRPPPGMSLKHIQYQCITLIQRNSNSGGSEKGPLFPAERQKTEEASFRGHPFSSRAVWGQNFFVKVIDIFWDMITIGKKGEIGNI